MVVPRRRRDPLRNGLNPDGTIGQAIEGLLDNPQTLGDFAHAHQVTGKTVALPRDRDLEVKLWVNTVRFVLADVIGDAAAPQTGTGECIVPGLLGTDHPDLLGAVDKDNILRHQGVIVPEPAPHFWDEGLRLFDEQVIEVAAYPSKTAVAVSEAAACHLTEDTQNILAIVAEGIKERRNAPQVHDISAEPEQVARNTVQFDADRPDVFSPRRNLDTASPLYGAAIGIVKEQPREVIHTARVRHELEIGAVLGHVLVTAVDVTYHRFTLPHILTLKSEQ